jgi:hypothetical protein
MYQFLRKQVAIFLAGFLIAFIVYLFWKLTSEELLIGVLIGGGGGLVLTVGLYLLERQFPEQIPGSNEPPR